MSNKCQFLFVGERNLESNGSSFQSVKGPSKPIQKGTIQERNFYQCFCARSYQSYSALYLHVKLKHGVILSFKALKEKSTEWSGSTKNVYYEFGEDR